MQLVPVQCRGCTRIYLESTLVVVADNVLCECGGIARALSSDVYAAGDETLFDAVVSSLVLAEVSALTAAQLLGALQDRALPAPGQALGRLSKLVPGLGIIELITLGNAETTRKAEAMFETVLEALAAARSRSDLAPRLGSAPSERRRRGRR